MATTLSKGDASNKVKALQQALNAKGAHLVVDGKFGTKTAAAVTKFQQSAGLRIGAADAATQRALGIGDSFTPAGPSRPAATHAPTAKINGGGAGQFPQVAAQPLGAYAGLDGLNQVWSAPRAGVTLATLSGKSTTLGAQRVHAAIVDVAAPDLRVRATTSSEKGKTVSAWAKKTHAVVALNGDFFKPGFQTLGFNKGEGTALRSPAESTTRTSIAFDANDRATVDGENAINPALASAVSVVSGTKDMLLQNGQTRGGPEHAGPRHPRSAIGVTSDGKAIFLAVEGRRSDAKGLTFLETAELMRALGAVDAVMLDGGFSTALVVDGVRLNRLPQGSTERAVANHIGAIAA